MKGKTIKRHDRRRKLATALILGAMGATAAEPAFAQDIQQISDERIEFDIAAQPLSSALSEFARQAHVNALNFSDDLRRLPSPQLHGSYTRQQALDLLLARSGYNGRISGGNLVLAQEQSSRPQQESAASGAEAQTSADEQASGDEEEIVVTGTRIRGAAPAGSHVITIDREEIDRTGRGTVQDVLQTLPQNFAGSQNEATQEGTQNARSNFTYGSTVDLRGLGADATLTLVDGHRLAPAGVGGHIDISTIPLSAVERVEVLADGASAAYGADAVAGVVNIILRDDFEGAETGLRFGATSQGGASERAFYQLLGASWRTGQIMGAYEYRARDELNMLDRPFLATADFTDRGGTDFRGTRSNPGNIIRIGATTVSLPIPEGQDGTSLSQSDLVTGPLNRNEINELAFFLPRQEAQSLFVRGRQELTPSLELYGRVIGSERDVYLEREQLFANLIVPESNYYRQLNGLFLGQGNLTVSYYLGDDLGSIINRAEIRAWSGVGGLRYEVGDSDWVIDGSVAYAHSEEAIFNENFYNSAAAGPALASGNVATAFNPFADGSNTPASVLTGLTFDIETFNDAETIVSQVQADGPLWRIWGGDIRLAVGIERRDERFEIVRREVYPSGPVNQFIQNPGERTIDALFAEVNVPLINADNNVPLVHALTISASVRHEDASDYGDSTTPRFGVRWALTPDFALRASWGQSFKGPQFSQMLGDIVLSYATATPAQDPLADNGSTGVLTVGGSNGDLRPETAENWTAGFDYSPSWANGLNLRTTWGDHAPADAALTAPDYASPAAYEPARPSPLETEADAARTSSILFSARREGAAPAYAESFSEDGRRAAFLNGQRGRDDGVLDATYAPPRSPYTIQAGATISAALMTALNSDQPGRVIAQVSENVFDSVTGETLLIPQGARLIGSYDADTAYGERRLLVVWNRLIMPNGWSIPLRAMPGADAAGSAGLTGDVDAHIGRIVVASLISAVLGVAANESEDEDDARLSQSIGDAAAQQAAQTGSRLIDRELNVRPTLRIRAGARVRVLVSQDIQLRPYPP